jgi:putative oxidoreductase
MTKRFFTSKPLWENGLFIIRLLTGMLIVKFGRELFDESIMKDLGGFLEKETPIPAPYAMAYAAKGIEFFGGIFLTAGLLTRWVTPPLMVTMGVIIWKMEGGNMFNGGNASLFLLLFLLFFFVGPGKWSLDHLLFDRRQAND